MTKYHITAADKTKKLVENVEMDYVEMMFEMYGDPETSYGDNWLRKCGYSKR